MEEGKKQPLTSSLIWYGCCVGRPAASLADPHNALMTMIALALTATRTKETSRGAQPALHTRVSRGTLNGGHLQISI